MIKKIKKVIRMKAVYSQFKKRNCQLIYSAPFFISGFRVFPTN